MHLVYCIYNGNRTTHKLAAMYGNLLYANGIAGLIFEHGAYVQRGHCFYKGWSLIQTVEFEH